MTTTLDNEPRTPRTMDFQYVFPAIRGVQAGREHYVTMCPLRLIPKLFLFDDEELMPELRAQRTLNRARIPEISRYLVNNADTYVFSALTASVDSKMHFEPFGERGSDQRVGRLTIPMDARLVINDGQHRRAGIQQALAERPELGDESIAVVFFLDVGLARSQQMFADLNLHSIRAGRSLGVLYDQRDESSAITRAALYRIPVLRNLVEMERNNLSTRSRKLFTLSGIHTATRSLLDGIDGPQEELVTLVEEFWMGLMPQFPEWGHVDSGDVSAGEIRRDFIHSHGIALQAFGRIGNTLARQARDPRKWQRSLVKLRDIDWRRANTELWEGRAIVNGRVSKSSVNILLTTAAIRQLIGMPLQPDEADLKAIKKDPQ